MPDEGMTFLDRDELLTNEQLTTLAEVAVGTGIRKIRVTGGEPLVRKDIVPLLSSFGAIPELERLVLTTNGTQLGQLAGPLKEAGVSGVNISLDSLKPDTFHTITKTGQWEKSWDGMHRALEVGLRTKLNVVVMRGVNDDEILDFVRLTEDLPVEVRFIEYMPTKGKESDISLTLPAQDVLDRVATEMDLQPLGSEIHAGPAKRFQVENWAGTIGVISPISCHFCQDCNRIRVTATGLARSCLFHEDGLDLRPLLVKGDRNGLARALTEVVAIKPETHQLEQKLGPESDGPDSINMSRLGG